MGCHGMTLVEIMVAMVIVSIIAGIVWNVSLTQMQSAEEGGSVLESEGAPTAGLELIKRDLAWAGYGVLDISNKKHPKNSAFFIRDGGANGSDKLYIHDGVYIEGQELAYDLNNSIGFAHIVAGSGTASLTLGFPSVDGTSNTLIETLRNCTPNNPLNLDQCPSEFDTTYSGGDANEFKGGIWQYVITNTQNYNRKVARITSVNTAAFKLNLDNPVNGGSSTNPDVDDLVSPAVYYCVDFDVTDANCHPAGGPKEVLRRSSRSFSGRQPVAENIVDMQVAYKKGNKWYCDGIGPCPTNSFIPGEIDLIRITLVARTGKSAGNAILSVENGPNWGNDGFAYKTFSTSIRARNSIEFK